MNYELAKNLKEGGFPQNTEKIYCDSIGDEWKHIIIRSTDSRQFSDGKPAYKNYVAIPDLSELIEACGDRLTILENWGDGWSAYEEQQDLVGIECKGSSPIEAVAKLWLTLNKK